jgi:hypothetical protein
LGSSNGFDSLRITLVAHHLLPNHQRLREIVRHPPLADDEISTCGAGRT